jgi:DNA-binding XRE family transcriptional regulator
LDWVVSAEYQQAYQFQPKDLILMEKIDPGILLEMPITPDQCRAARALLDWTQDELAERAEVSRSTVRGFEGRQHELHRATAAAIRRALEAAGVELLDADASGGEGVRRRHPASGAA